jgi:excisionase family DNA binding protein
MSIRDHPIFTVTDVAEILNTSPVQVMALLHRGELEGFQMGGRGQWRVEETELEAYIDRMKAAARARRQAHRSKPALEPVAPDAGPETA